MKLGKNISREYGFTLIEFLVVSVLTILITISLLKTFTGSLRNQSLNNIIALFDADLRKAQSLTTSTLQYQGSRVCGYGLHYQDVTSYIIYTIPRPLKADCTKLNHNFTSARDLVYETIKLKVPNVMINAPFNDIFFEPPDLRVYVDNKSFPQHSAAISTRATFCFINDPANCRSLEIFLSGQINSI